MSTNASHLPLKISETLGLDYQEEMTYGESNGHVTDDVTWPRKIELVTPIRLERNILKTAGDAI